MMKFPESSKAWNPKHSEKNHLKDREVSVPAAGAEPAVTAANGGASITATF